MTARKKEDHVRIGIGMTTKPTKDQILWLQEHASDELRALPIGPARQSEQAHWLHAVWQCADVALGKRRAQSGSSRAEATALCARVIDGENVPLNDLRRVTMPKGEREHIREERADIVQPPPLAAAARAAGYEPETEEGGRAMMQAITPEHLCRAEAVRKMRTLKPGDEIQYTNFTVGGSFQGKAIVTWDHGKSVEARTLGGEKLRLERAADGSLRRFT